eukprot:Gregarina_sp_Poly_1__11480@NODE_989_length_5454_cov_5_659922_g695_i0_p3_GENE_NODE_989_length_5454_cov_5_659922_g695_i0NODE_989_length_5454_cov_5_659922_g695_i0_p3_ORF_typecomplete_len130_score13_81_NODE_989_length_5454_cov_5_659922_g695_i020212410
MQRIQLFEIPNRPALLSSAFRHDNAGLNFNFAAGLNNFQSRLVGVSATHKRRRATKRSSMVSRSSEETNSTHKNEDNNPLRTSWRVCCILVSVFKFSRCQKFGCGTVVSISTGRSSVPMANSNLSRCAK